MNTVKRKNENNDLCLWTRAGVLGKKRCDQNFDCEHCQIDQLIRTAFEKTQHQNNVFKYFISPTLLENIFDSQHYFVCPKHMWIRKLNNKEVKVGIDDLAAILLGSIDKVILSEPNEQVKKNHNCCQIIQADNIFCVRTPVSGTVKKVNTDLLSFADELTLDPYRKGWLLVIEADNLEKELHDCRSGETLFKWHTKEMKEIEKLILKTIGIETSNLGKTLANGGETSRQIRYHMTKEQYEALVTRVLGSCKS